MLTVASLLSHSITGRIIRASGTAHPAPIVDSASPLCSADSVAKVVGVLARRRSRRAHSLSPNPGRTASPICPDLIYDRHRSGNHPYRPSRPLGEGCCRRPGRRSSHRTPAKVGDRLRTPPSLTFLSRSQKAPHLRGQLGERNRESSREISASEGLSRMNKRQLKNAPGMG